MTPDITPSVNQTQAASFQHTTSVRIPAILGLHLENRPLGVVQTCFEEGRAVVNTLSDTNYRWHHYTYLNIIVTQICQFPVACNAFRQRHHFIRLQCIRFIVAACMPALAADIHVCLCTGTQPFRVITKF